MSTRDIVSILSVAGPVLGGVVALVLGVIGIVRHFSRKVTKAENRARRAEKERDIAGQRLADAQAMAEQAIKGRDRAERERDEEKKKREMFAVVAAKNKETSDNNLRAWKNWKAHAEKLQKALTYREDQITAITKQDGRVWCSPHCFKPPDFVQLGTRSNRRPVIISVFNLKGGVGKTTLTANLGGFLANRLKKWVLLLDLDHQRSLTQTLFTSHKRIMAAKAGHTIQEFFRSEPTGTRLRQVAQPIEGEGYSRLWVVGNSDAQEGYGNTQNLDDLELAMLGKWLLNPTKSDIRYLLRSALHSATIQEQFEYVVIDCPPRLTTACINALLASDFLLIPAEAGHVSARSISHLIRRLGKLSEAGFLEQLRILGVVGNMVSTNADKATREGKILRENAALASKLWGSPIRLLKTVIRESDYYAKYQRDSEEKGLVQLPSVAVEAIREQYQKLTQELEGIINENLRVAGVPS